MSDDLGMEGSAIVQEMGFGLGLEFLFVDLGCSKGHNLVGVDLQRTAGRVEQHVGSGGRMVFKYLALSAVFVVRLTERAKLMPRLYLFRMVGRSCKAFPFVSRPHFRSSSSFSHSSSTRDGKRQHVKSCIAKQREPSIPVRSSPTPLILSQRKES